MVLLFFLLPILTVATGLLIYHLMHRRRWNVLDKIPAHFGNRLPLLGSALELKTDPAEFRLQLLEIGENFRDKGLVILALGEMPVIGLFKAEFVEKLLGESHLEKAYVYEFLKPWLGDGLISTSKLDRWQKYRKLLTPSFHFNILKDFSETLNEHAQVLVDRLDTVCSKEQIFDVFEFMSLATLDGVTECAMGKNISAQTDQAGRSWEWVNAICNISTYIQDRQKKPWNWITPLYKMTPKGREFYKNLDIIHSFVKAITIERNASFDRDAVGGQMAMSDEVIEESSAKPVRKLAFLDTLLYASENFTKLSLDEILEEANTFMFAGHDTTAAAASWTLYQLARHPEEQAKVHAELDEIFGSSSRAATADDIRKFVHLECAFKEAMRMYPSVPLFGRHLQKDVKFGDYLLPKGSDVVVLSEALHNDPIQFEDPKEYRPSRFLLENSKGRHAYAYVPFSGGQRNCIGMRFAILELKILLSSALRHFSFTTQQCEADFRPAGEIVTRPTKTLYLKPHLRN